MIVFTIYKNGGNAGAFGASFGCAVFGVRGSSGVNAGALCLTGAASYTLTPPARFRFALLRRALCRAVLNDDDGAARGRTR